MIDQPNLRQDQPALLGIPKTLDFVGDLSRATLYRLWERGVLVPAKIGRRTLYRRTDLIAYVASLAPAVAVDTNVDSETEASSSARGKR